MEIVVLEPDGRVRLPERMLAELGLAEGDALAVEARDGRLVLEPADPARLELEDGVPVVRGVRVPPGVNLVAEAREERLLTLLDRLHDAGGKG